MLGLAALVCVTALPSPPLDQITFSLSDDSRPTSSLAPDLAASLSLEHRTQLTEYLEAYTEPRLVQLRGEKEPRWITEGEKALLVWNQTRFVDVTDYEAIEGLAAAATPSQAPANTYPKKLKHRAKQLRSLFDKIDLVAMKHLCVLLLCHLRRSSGHSTHPLYNTACANSPTSTPGTTVPPMASSRSCFCSIISRRCAHCSVFMLHFYSKRR